MQGLKGLNSLANPVRLLNKIGEVDCNQNLSILHQDNKASSLISLKKSCEDKRWMDSKAFIFSEG